MPYPLLDSAKGPLDGPFFERVGLQVCIPSGDTWNAGFAMSVIQLQLQLFQTHAAKQTYFNVNNRLGSMLALNREDMVLNALENKDVTHILFLDSDMTFPADTANHMLWRNQPILCANYVKRAVPTVPTVRGMDGRLLATLDNSTGLEPVLYAGLGVAMFHRDVFENVPRPWFSFDWVKDADGVLRQRGEDVHLFNACREAGYDVLVDHDLSKHVTHQGVFDYTTRMAFLDEEEGVYDEDGSYTPERKLAYLKEKANGNDTDRQA